MYIRIVQAVRSRGTLWSLALRSSERAWITLPPSYRTYFHQQFLLGRQFVSIPHQPDSKHLQKLVNLFLCSFLVMLIILARLKSDNPVFQIQASITQNVDMVIYFKYYYRLCIPFSKVRMCTTVTTVLILTC